MGKFRTKIPLVVKLSSYEIPRGGETYWKSKLHRGKKPRQIYNAPYFNCGEKKTLYSKTTSQEKNIEARLPLWTFFFFKDNFSIDY